MALTSPRFRWSTPLQQAEMNSPAIRNGAHGNAVRILQQSMIDLGIDPMTSSVKKYGSPDGIFGRDTKNAIEKYQRSKGLKGDGIVGQKTMRGLDADLPGAGPNLPPLPSPSRYVVPGLMVARDQLRLGQNNLCWAYVNAMMVSWKRQQSVDARQLVSNIGANWLTLFDNNRGLPWIQTTMFFRAAGMRVEPLVSFPVSEWAEMLKSFGPLTVYSRNNMLSGGHARVLYGVQGAGNHQSTTMLVLDPWGGRDYGESFEKFNAKYEGAAGVSPGQIGHF